MQRAWATGTEHDRGPQEWLAAIDDQSTVADHIRLALDAAIAQDATIAQCQAGMLAIECVTYVHGGDADLDPHVHVWMRERAPAIDEDLRATALAALAKLRTSSALATHWSAQSAEARAEWAASLANLHDRLTTAKRKPDPRDDPRVVALGTSFMAAKAHLRVALVPYEITDEPSVHVRVAPGLSVVVHYADIEGLEPLAVPSAHALAWNRTAKELAKVAAKRTREVSDLRTHTLENEGFEISLAFGNSSFTAGLLAYPDLLLAEGGAPHGILVAAPNQGTVVYHRIKDANWNEAAVELVGHVRDIYTKSAHQVSPQLWWWHKGAVIELPYTVIADNVIIEPVAAFVSHVKPLG